MTPDNVPQAPPTTDGSFIKRAGPMLLATALLGLIGWEVAATLRQHGTQPTDADWRDAAAKLRSLRQDGEPILIAPRWAEPIGRLSLAGQMDIGLASLSDVDRYARVWELSIRSARHSWLRAATPHDSWRFGRVTLSLFEHDPVHVLFDFRRRLSEAHVELVGDELQTCRPRGTRFICDPNQSSSWVGPHLAEVGFRPYTCIYAHPVAGKRLLITFPKVPLGNTLVGYTGIDDVISRRDAKAPVLLQTFVDGQLLISRLHRNNWPWMRFMADTGRFAGHDHQVRFEISAENVHRRTFCFHAEARR